MIFYLLLCHVLFIPLINSSNTTVSKLEVTNITLAEPVPHKANQSNETKVTLLSEGGSLLPVSSVLALPKDKLTSLDSELSKNKLKPVVARKGVVYIEDENVKPPQSNVSTNNENPTVGPKIQEETAHSTKNVTDSPNKTTQIESKVNSSLLNTSGAVKNVNITEIHKKPLLLSYDSLANMTVKSSPETILNQIQSPNKEKAYVKNANSHPGMIMPLVISILLVPMFAVLGYMALRRGQEAWKNRHYKRMDFLLDGMYND
ncbi:hypothetical protein PYW08_015295 [Mythimna loreyi]|uniref:Uncharacterized protein n=1 Tax=Mythimna loreyi TaxID=667449 RepID=A0ACC2QW93_9NEOP|nr:hypothetical protein PYW08_015295 [Mythimna loreyi]